MPEWAMGAGFFCVTQTADELSIVCEEGRVPHGVRVEKRLGGTEVGGAFSFFIDRRALVVSSAAGNSGDPDFRGGDI